jgi:hypothetical protein
MSHPQQPYGHGQHPGRTGGRPPRKLTAVLVAALGGVVLVLALGYGGYAALALVRDNGTAPAAQPGQDGANAGQAFLQAVVASANDKDVAVLRELACPEPGRNVQPAIDYVGTTEEWKLAGSRLVSNDKLDATVRISFRGAGTDEFHVIAVRDEGDWCWNDIVASTPSPRPSPTSDPQLGKGVDFTQGVLTKLNDGDAAGAKRLLCPDSSSQTDIDAVAKATVKLRIDNDAVEDTGDYVGIDLKGTFNGEPISSGRVAAFLEDGGWCVHTFYVIP